MTSCIVMVRVATALASSSARSSHGLLALRLHGIKGLVLDNLAPSTSDAGSHQSSSTFSTVTRGGLLKCVTTRRVHSNPRWSFRSLKSFGASNISHTIPTSSLLLLQSPPSTSFSSSTQSPPSTRSPPPPHHQQQQQHRPSSSSSAITSSAAAPFGKKHVKGPYSSRDKSGSTSTSQRPTSSRQVQSAVDVHNSRWGTSSSTSSSSSSSSSTGAASDQAMKMKRGKVIDLKSDRVTIRSLKGLSSFSHVLGSGVSVQSASFSLTSAPPVFEGNQLELRRAFPVEAMRTRAVLTRVKPNKELASSLRRRVRFVLKLHRYYTERVRLLLSSASRLLSPDSR